MSGQLLASCNNNNNDDTQVPGQWARVSVSPLGCHCPQQICFLHGRHPSVTHSPAIFALVSAMSTPLLLLCFALRCLRKRACAWARERGLRSARRVLAHVNRRSQPPSSHPPESTSAFSSPRPPSKHGNLARLQGSIKLGLGCPSLAVGPPLHGTFLAASYTISRQTRV